MATWRFDFPFAGLSLAGAGGYFPWTPCVPVPPMLTHAESLTQRFGPPPTRGFHELSFVPGIATCLPRRMCLKQASGDAGSEQRCGFTLIEVLVAIGIAVVLLALLLSAIQRVRETANRVLCCNQLRQLATAFHLHHDTHAVLPSNGGSNPLARELPANGSGTFIPSTDLYFPQVLLQGYLGAGDPLLGPADQTGSWAYALLPYVDQGNVHRARAWWQPVNSTAQL